MNVERPDLDVLGVLGLEKDNLAVKDIFPKGELLDLEIKERARPSVILVEGPLSPSNIILEPSSDRIALDPTLNKYISIVWNDAERQFRKKFPGREFTNELKVLVRGISKDGDKVIIKTGITDYRERIATIKSEYRKAQRFGSESVAIQLATSSVILTGDGKICLAQLGSKTEEKNKVGGIHTIGGLLEMRKDKTPISPSENILNEISEELGFGPTEVREDFRIESIMGIVQDPKIFATDIIYLFKTTLSEHKIRSKYGKSDKEIILIFVDNTEIGVKNALLLFAKTGTSTALSGLYLYGKLMFGEEWVVSVRERLVRRFTIWNRLDSIDNDFPEEIRKRTANRLTRLHG